MKSIIDYWIDEGVLIFRVDNPHTKSFPFWKWVIAEVKAAHPDVIFLAEAFTRPKVMYRLAKLGFTQSYTYFTWRNTKEDLTEYLEELTQWKSSNSSVRISGPIPPTFCMKSCRPAAGLSIPQPFCAGRYAFLQLRHLRAGIRAVREHSG